MVTYGYILRTLEGTKLPGVYETAAAAQAVADAAGELLVVERVLAIGWAVSL